MPPSNPVRSAAAQAVPTPAPAPGAPAPAAAAASARNLASSADTGSKTRVRTRVTKGEHGIGLDLAKTADGGVFVTRLKDMPPGVVNPAASCTPPINAGDVIVGVNGQPCALFADVVKAIRGASGVIELLLERA